MITSNNVQNPTLLLLPFILIARQIGTKNILKKKCTKKKAYQFESHDLILLLFIVEISQINFVIRS